MFVEPTPPPCPECSGDMMGFPQPETKEFLVWLCRCCGAAFVYDENYNLQPYSLIEEVDEETSP